MEEPQAKSRITACVFMIAEKILIHSFRHINRPVTKRRPYTKKKYNTLEKVENNITRSGFSRGAKIISFIFI
jgi:hypothetical protein